MITVIGKMADTTKYSGAHGYNVMPFCDDWTPARNQAWLDEAIERGDQILIASADVSGAFRDELIYLLEKLIGT